MIFERSKNGNFRFSRIHPLLGELLQAVAMDPWERYPEGSSRLLPSPCGSEDLENLEDLRLDWQDHVQPGLRHHFDLERAVVSEDLACMTQRKGKIPSWTLEIPTDHSDAWLTTLNALRLALAEEHRFTEEDLSEKTPSDLETERGLALMQVNFYAFIQECLLQAMDDELGG
ncbi:MAG: DUF2017 family protein [Chthoniobacterales bacterium]|jgi:hypothetical protein|nr:DUF2017 family protein [Chthoniobacterales bacterium]